MSENQRGSGTIVVLGIIAVLLIFLGVIAGLTSVSSANHRATTAADLSALAAADAARGLRSGDPCDVAEQVATANKAQLVGCASPAEDSEVMDVRVQVTVAGPFVFIGPAESVSRAGPPNGK